MLKATIHSTSCPILPAAPFNPHAFPVRHTITTSILQRGKLRLGECLSRWRGGLASSHLCH